MMSMSRCRMLMSLTAATLLWMGAAGAGPSIVTNGSFETGPDMLSRGFMSLPDGSTEIEGWTVITDIDYIGRHWDASDGARSLDLCGTEAGGIRQNLSTIVGALYLVEFDLAGNPDGRPEFKMLEVSAAGDSETFMFDASRTKNKEMGWTRNHWTFTAVGTETTLTFRSLTEGAFGPALDNACVTNTIPAPGAILLAGLGTGIVGWARRRRAV